MIEKGEPGLLVACPALVQLFQFSFALVQFGALRVELLLAILGPALHGFVAGGE